MSPKVASKKAAAASSSESSDTSSDDEPATKVPSKALVNKGNKDKVAPVKAPTKVVPPSPKQNSNAGTQKNQVGAKKAPAPSSSSDSSSSDDDEPAVKAPPKVAAKPPKPAPAPKAAPPAKPKESSIPKPVPENKFPKRKAPSTSSSSSSDDSDDEPATKKGKQAPKAPQNAKANNVSAPGSQSSQPKVTPQSPKVVPPSPKIGLFPTPKVTPPSPKVALPSPKHNSPAHTPSNQAAVRQTLVPSPPRRDAFEAATPNFAKRQFATASGDETPRTDTKKAVTNMFGSSCPHCGHEIEVKIKFS